MEILRYILITFIFLLSHLSLFAQSGLVVNEVFANPNNSSLTTFEFIELYNNSSSSIDLNEYILHINNNQIPLTNIRIAPQQYLILTSAEAEASLSPYGNIFITSRWYALSNTSAIIKITKNNLIIDEISYYNNWHNTTVKRNGGWSLERINPNWNCDIQNNWGSSVHPMGATPGKQNSIHNNKQQPQIDISNFKITANSIRLTLNSPLSHLGNLMVDNFKLTPSVGNPNNITMDAPNNSITLHFSQPIHPQEMYVLEIGGITFCNLPIEERKLILFEQPDVKFNDIVINEILFNPKDGGSDFVELYNTTNKAISLQNWKIGNRTISTELIILEPQNYLVITTNKESLVQLYPNALVKNIHQVVSLPAYSNQQGIVTLYSHTSLLMDSLFYNAEMHSPILTDQKGISLERQSYFKPTNSSENFKSASTITRGATPGYQNSNNIDIYLKKNFVFLSSKIITPNNMDNNRFLELNYDFMTTENIANVTVFDEKGRVVNRLIRQQTIGNQGKITWDTLDINGTKVSPGHYILLMEIWNTAGEKKQYKLAFVISTTH